MNGGIRNCVSVRKRLVERIREVLETPEHYIGKGQVDYDWTIQK